MAWSLVSLAACHWNQRSARNSGSHESYLDELIVDDRGGKRFVCSDTDYCTQRRACQEEGEDAQ